MAKSTVHGALILPFSAEPRDPLQCRAGALRFLEIPLLHFKDSYKNRVRSSGSRGIGSVGKKKSTSSTASEEFLHEEDEEADGDSDMVVLDGEEDEFERDELSCFRGLVLDISYRPVNVVCWRRAICLEFMEKADVLEYYDQTVSSPSGSFYIPAVLRVVKRRRIKHTLGRKSIFHRDQYTCQYCYSRDNLTIDHVLPISRGGEWKWENLVTACAKCNSKKGQKTLAEVNMKLTKVPKVPKDFDILAIPLTNTAMRMLRMRKGLPNEWHQYLSKPISEP